MPGTSSNGFLLKLRTSTGPDVFTTIAQVNKATPPKWVRNFEEVRITEDEYPVVMPTTLEGMQVPVSLLFDQTVPAQATAGHDALRTALEGKTLGVYQLIAPDGGAYQFQFSAYVQEWGHSEYDANGTPIMLDIVLRLSSKPTVTP
jgi:hypothetical protein